MSKETNEKSEQRSKQKKFKKVPAIKKNASMKNTSTKTVAITAKKLSKAFGARKALSNVSFELPQGAFLSVFGHNGAGKSTLLRILTTLTRPTSGNAQLFGYDLKEQPEQLRNLIGLISHKSMLYPDLTAEENLFVVARLYGVPEPSKRVNQMLATVELTPRRHDVVRGFSRGMTQRLSIARALVHDPQLVFLDEPYSGLDPHAVDIFDKLIASVREEHSFCMVSHDLQKGLSLASHVLILERGKVVLFGEREELGDACISACYYNSLGLRNIQESSEMLLAGECA